MNFQRKTDALLRTVTKFIASGTFRLFIFATFIAQAGFLVFVTHLRTPPDEGNQIDFIKYYAHHSLSPFLQHQMPTVNLGDVTRQVDYIYHFVMSFVLRLSPLPDHYDLYIVRLFSIVFAVLTFAMLLRILRELNVGRAASHLGLFALMNLPMVLMMASAVNADVLVWLGVVSGIYYMLRLWKEHRPVDLLLLLIIAIYGGIVKRTLFPVCFVFGIVAIVMMLKYWHDIRQKLNLRYWKQLALAFILLVGIGLFAERVGGNLYQYHTIAPSCAQVQGDKACSVFWLHDRKVALDDDADTAAELYLGDGSSVDRTLSPLPIFYAKWSVASFDNIVDIQTQGWEHDVPPPFWLGAVLLVLVVVTIGYGIVYEFRRSKFDEKSRWRLIIIGFALLVIVSQFVVNYGTYQRSHVFGLALNGRYILPALILLVGPAVWYGRKLFGRVAGPILISLVIVGVIGTSGLIMMVRNPQLFHGG